MSTVETVLVPAPTETPRGAQWIGRLTDLFRRRAADAAFTVQARFNEADAVRAMARSVSSSDPSLAADLFAAADRHANRKDR